jgi:hypothetical protein
MLIAQQVKAMMAELGYFESKFVADKVNGTRIGKYQVDAALLKTAGYVTSATATLSSNASWTGKDKITSQQDFFNAVAFQDIIQYNEFKTNYAALIANGGIKADDDICTASGMLFVAHQFRSVDAAKKWRDSDAGTDALGKTGDIYFNQGRYAIDVLYASAIANLPAPLTPKSATPNTSGIDTNAVLRFANQGSGTQSNFDQLDSDFKSRILKMADDYKKKTGSSITITSAYRSQADQDRIYQSWVNAGGGPNNPTAGGITTPAKPVSLGGKGSPHKSGVAIDSSESKAIARTVELAQYGLRWGGTFSKPDDVHIQLANVSP